MAGLGKKTFTAGDILTASQVNGYLMDQSVMTFADSASRGSAVTVPSDGMMSYLQDTNTIEAYRTSGTAIAAWEPVATGMGNKIINGNFDINQRAFTTTTTTATYGFDRWKTVIAGDGTSTYSAQTFTAGTAPVAGYEARNFARIVTTGQTSAAVISQLVQPIEDVRTFANSTVTVSFWAKAASGTPKIAVEIDQNFGSGGSPSSAVQTYAGQVTISTSWARYYVTVAVPSISGKTIGTTANTSYVALNLWMSAGSTYNSRTDTLGIQTGTFDVWGVQVEQGSTVSPFQTATQTKQTELAACQRYYFRVTGGVGANFGNGYVSTANTAFRGLIAFPVEMRIIPTALEQSGSAGDYGIITAGLTTTCTAVPTFNTATAAAATITLTISATVAGGIGGFIRNVTTSAYLAWSAEF
jgi:hypothetical protein